MGSDKTAVLLDDLVFPEGPRWHHGRLWFSDMNDLRVKTVTPDGHMEVVHVVPGQPSGLGWLPDGRLLVVSMTDRRLLRQDGDALVEHADLSKLADFHCNDMVTDARGNSYLGNFGFDLHAGEKPRPTCLILVTEDGDARVVAEDLSFPNGSIITPDGKTLVVGESWGARLTAFDIDEDGSLSNRRVWAQIEGAVPDGCCLDAEGAIWVASPMGKELVRVREGGEITHRIRTGTDTMAIACMLGGPERRTLFVCSAGQLDPADGVREGRIEIAEVEVPGAGLP